MTKGLTRTGFDEDLVLGHEAEGQLAQALLASGARIEVKADTRAHETGNIYVEFRFRGRPSGIASSKAEWWVYRILDRFIVIPLPTLRALTRRALRERGGVVRGGDFDQSEGALVPVAWLLTEVTP